MKHDFSELGELVHEILHTIYVAERRTFERQAKARNITVEQLAAASICGALEEKIGNGKPGSRGN